MCCLFACLKRYFIIILAVGNDKYIIKVSFLFGRRYNFELSETVRKFIRLSVASDRIICRRIRNGNVIIISKLAKDIGESIVPNTNYGISMQLQEKPRNLIHCIRLYN